jgi:uncharacterized protein (DUF2267 family)
MIKKEVPGLNRTIHETNNWLTEIADEIGQPDAQVAYHALRGVLFATRDRLTVEEALDLAAQLPALIRGVYFEGYKATGKPDTYRDRDTFLECVNEELSVSNGADPAVATRAVFTVMNAHISPGEIDDVRQMMPESIRDLWPAPEEEPAGSVS